MTDIATACETFMQEGPIMTPIASHITAFLRERLLLQRRASHHTCESYAYTFQLLLRLRQRTAGSDLPRLCLEHLDAQLVMDFLAHLETQRGNGPYPQHAPGGHQSLYAIRRISRPVEPRTKPPGAGDPQEETDQPP